MPEDPRMRLTDWLTRKRDKGENTERTRVQNKEQKQYYTGDEFLAHLFPSLAFMASSVEGDKEQMVAFKGLRSEEVTKALVHQEIMQDIETGLRGAELKREAESRGKGKRY